MNLENLTKYAELWFGYSLQDRSRNRANVDMRRMLCYMMRSVGKFMTFEQIAEKLGWKGHETALYHFNKHSELIEWDDRYFNDFISFLRSLNNNAEAISIEEFGYLVGEVTMLRTRGIANGQAHKGKD